MARIRKRRLQMGSQLHRSTIHRVLLPYLSSECALLAGEMGQARSTVSSGNENSSSNIDDNIYKVYEINHHDGGREQSIIPKNTIIFNKET
jgi:hypothetical protein